MAKISNVFVKDEVKKTLHPKRITKWIHYTKLKRNENQYCDAKDKEEIEGLADIIWICWIVSNMQNTIKNEQKKFQKNMMKKNCLSLMAILQNGKKNCMI